MMIFMDKRPSAPDWQPGAKVYVPGVGEGTIVLTDDGAKARGLTKVKLGDGLPTLVPTNVLQIPRKRERPRLPVNSRAFFNFRFDPTTGRVKLTSVSPARRELRFI